VSKAAPSTAECASLEVEGRCRFDRLTCPLWAGPERSFQKAFTAKLAATRIGLALKAAQLRPTADEQSFGLHPADPGDDDERLRSSPICNIYETLSGFV
jgi:hypothetical protein